MYAHNDEMALGAIAAIEAAGKVPGKDILVVSIDGEKDAIQAIVAHDGKLGCSCECNPRFRPVSVQDSCMTSRRRRKDPADDH